MTIRQPLFQQNDTTDQAAEIGRNFLRDIFSGRGGLITEDSLKVTQRAAGANDSVDIAPGGLIVPGTEASTQGAYHLGNDRTFNIKMPTPADSTNPRIDAIVLRVRDTDFASGDPGGIPVNDGIVDWVTGTAASVPVAPDLDALGLENYYCLAKINVGKNDNVITSSDIIDCRASPVSEVQGRATTVGGIIVCASTTRPTLPRLGQSIWETDTKKWLINEGTPTVPDWVTYGESGGNKWVNYAPNFPLSGSYTTYGRYLKIGTTIFGVAGFKLLGGTGNVTSTITCKIPYPAKNPAIPELMYMGGGRAFDSTGLFQGVYWSCAADIVQGTTLLVKFATIGSVPWNAVTPFDWGAGSNIYAKADHMSMIYLYESAT